MQILGKSRKGSYRFRIAIGRYGHKDFRRSYIDAGSIGPHHGQIPLQLPMLPFLCFGHGSPPSMFGNEPGVQKWEIFQAGSSHTNSVARHQCSGARAWDQTDERARRSKHQWEYDLRLSLPWRSFKIPLGLDWSAPNASSFLLWRWPQLELLMRNGRFLIRGRLSPMRNSPFLIWGEPPPMRNSSFLIWFWLSPMRNSPFLIWGGLSPMRNSSFLIWFWLSPMRNSPFLIWGGLSPM